ncbi:PID-CTERM protein-sorting domain-containing protein [Hymenobacter rubidus]|uniref:PID-CTERM protein-sorting domain-containing protein n=1 Tax=Hymenobacter rubidus TaxID=1441626 RepID=UPI0037420B02
MKLLFLNRLLPALLLVVAFGEVVLAQTGGPAPSPTATPLDGGVSLLLAGGVAYGIRHLRGRRKKA